MEFETPHPSIRTQDQIFKLPSSQPRHSPNLSPVPITATRSRNLKENRTSTPWTELTSQTLMSGGRSASVSAPRKIKEHQIHTTTSKKSLKANMKPRFSKPRNSKPGSGSGINQTLASPFVSRASSPTDNQASNINPSDSSSSKHRPIARTSIVTNLGKRGLSDTFYNTNLPSSPDQTHIAEGLLQREKGKLHHAQSAHTSPSSKAPPSVLLDLNTQLNQKRRRGHRETVSVDVTGLGYSEGLGGGTKTKKQYEGYQRERRPSAPSSYSHRSRPHALPLLVGASIGLEGTKTRRSKLVSGLEIIHNIDGAVSTGGDALTTVGIPTAGSASHADDNNFVQPFPPRLHNKNSITFAAPDMEMDWRVGIVDFNRPPSQMCHYPTTTMLSGCVGGDVFSSSESEGSPSDDDDKGMEGTETMANPTRAIRTRTRTARPLISGPMSVFDDPFGFGSVLPPDLNLNLDMELDQNMFGDGAWGMSTPLNVQIQAREEEESKKKKREQKMVLKAISSSDLRSKIGGLVRTRSLPVMSGVGWRETELNDYDQENGEEDDNEEQDPYEQEQEQEQDMDLTTPLITATIDAGTISTTLRSAEVAQLVDKRGNMTPWILDSLISPPSRYLKSQGEVERGGHPSFEHEDTESMQDQYGEILFSKTLSPSPSDSEHLLSSPFRFTTSPAAAATATNSIMAKRTRRGTIVPSSRIGNISDNTSININDPPRTRRTRSGTLVGPLPLPSRTGVQLAVGNGDLSVRKGRERSGTVLDLKSQGEIEQGGHPSFEHEDVESMQDQDEGNLFSKTLSSSPSEHLLSSLRLASDAHIHIQSQHEAIPSTTASPTAAATATTSFTAKRTRSGTIVPSSRISNISDNTSINVNTNDPPGTRRTRSGTLVGPLPLPSRTGVQLTVVDGDLSVRKGRKRSGTVLAGPSPPPLLPAGVVSAKRTSSGTVVRCVPPVPAPVFGSVPSRKSTTGTGPGLQIREEDMSTPSNMDEYGPHIDALYIPCQSSSPDPIDFLRLAHLQDYDGMREKLRLEREADPDFVDGELIEDEDKLVWCIADEPPSPIVRKNESKLGMMRRRYNKGGILSVGGGRCGDMRGNGYNQRRGEGSAKGQGQTKMRTRFMIGGHEEQPDEIMVESEEGEKSDDELLLRGESTLNIWD